MAIQFPTAFETVGWTHSSTNASVPEGEASKAAAFSSDHPINPIRSIQSDLPGSLISRAEQRQWHLDIRETPEPKQCLSYCKSGGIKSIKKHLLSDT
jgi:hypothetical protein